MSWELQRALSLNGALPGRISFDDDAGYGAYVDKVLAWESRTVPESTK